MKTKVKRHKADDFERGVVFAAQYLWQFRDCQVEPFEILDQIRAAEIVTRSIDVADRPVLNAYLRDRRERSR